MPKIIENPREVLLEHARKIILREGPSGLTMRKVSKSTGIAVGTIYNYFPTKREIMLQLMEDYWKDYLVAIEEIDNRNTDLYTKLRDIYEKLVTFFETFMEVWLKNNLTHHDGEGLSRRNNFIEKLNKRLEAILMEEQRKGTIILLLEPYEISKFIMQNFITMSQMKQFDYKNLEIIIKKLFQ